MEEAYKTIPFPFKEIKAPEFWMEAHWDIKDVLGFLNTWSATQQYFKQKGVHPLEKFAPELGKAWGEPTQKRLIRWPLHVRMGLV